MLDCHHHADDGDPSYPCHPDGPLAYVPAPGYAGENGGDAGYGVWRTARIGAGCRWKPARSRGIWHPLAASPGAAGAVGRGDSVASLSLVWPAGILQEPLLRHSGGQWVPPANPARRATNPRRWAW